MARAYSLDLRERVVGAVAAGQTCRSVAKTFMVSVASVVKWSQRQRAVGSPAALKMGGRRPYLVAREGLGFGADRREARSHAARSAQ
jgi:transposase